MGGEHSGSEGKDSETCHFERFRGLEGLYAGDPNVSEAGYSLRHGFGTLILVTGALLVGPLGEEGERCRPADEWACILRAGLLKRGLREGRREREIEGKVENE